MFLFCRRAGGLVPAEKKEVRRIMVPPARPALTPADKAKKAGKNLLALAQGENNNPRLILSRRDFRPA